MLPRNGCSLITSDFRQNFSRLNLDFSKHLVLFAPYLAICFPVPKNMGEKKVKEVGVIGQRKRKVNGYNGRREERGKA